MTAVVPMPNAAPPMILVVDDDPHIRQLLLFALKKNGLHATDAADGEAALEIIARSLPDLLLLDINMPRLDGLALCRRLRADPRTAGLPILFLSSRADEVDRIVGIELGGDDYVVKPFSPREVVARVGAILKRVKPTPVAGVPASQHPIMVLGRLQLNAEAWEARFDGALVDTTATEFRLLSLLVSAPQRILSREMIIDRLHGPGFAVTDRTVDSHVRNLRAKFAAVGCHELIETRTGIGYRIGSCQ